MKLNELRINNWVKHNPSFHSLRNIDGVISNYGKFNEDCFQWELSDFDELEMNEDYIKAINKIKITEEWLSKFGFESSFISDPQKENASKKYVLNGFTLLQQNENISAFHIHIEYLDSPVVLVYIHELQNLYYSLTFKELSLSVC